MDSVFGKIRQQQSREDSWRNGDGIEGPGNVATLDSEDTLPLPRKRFEGLQFNPRLGRDFFVFFSSSRRTLPVGGGSHVAMAHAQRGDTHTDRQIDIGLGLENGATSATRIVIARHAPFPLFNLVFYNLVDTTFGALPPLPYLPAP